MKQSPFDLPEFDTTTKAEEGQWLDLLHPVTNGPTARRLKLAGPDSDKFRDAEEAWARKLANRPDVTDPVELLRLGDERRIFILSEITLDWNGFHRREGGEAAFSRGNVTLLYENHPEIVRQADRFLTEKRNWLAGVEGNLPSGDGGASG